MPPSSCRSVKICVACSRKGAKRIRPDGWMCEACWRHSVGMPPFVRMPLPDLNPSDPEPPYKHRPAQPMRGTIVITEARALVLRRCAEEPRSTEYLAEDTLCVKLDSAQKLARTMVRRGLLRKIGSRRGPLETTPFGLAYIKDFDAKLTDNTKESRP